MDTELTHDAVMAPASKEGPGSPWVVEEAQQFHDADDLYWLSEMHWRAHPPVVTPVVYQGQTKSVPLYVSRSFPQDGWVVGSEVAS